MEPVLLLRSVSATGIANLPEAIDEDPRYVPAIKECSKLGTLDGHITGSIYVEHTLRMCSFK